MKFTSPSTSCFGKVRLGVAATFFLFSVASAQVTNEIKLNEAPVEKAFKEIETKTGYHFFYKKELVDSSIRVTLDSEGESIDNILNKLSKETGLIFNIVGKQIVVSEIKEEKISGIVVDKDDKPIANAIIKNRGNNKTTKTDANGRFNLESALGDELEISKQGFSQYVLPVIDSEILFATLFTKEEEQTLENTIDEVVLTGYQKIDASRAAAAVEKVNMKNFSKRGKSDIISSIEGLAPSLVLNSNPSKPGSKEFNIRGISTLTGNSTPLIIVDGFPYEGNLRSINPYEIENITLLKDAASASIYGVKSSNGVIVITTKKGRRSGTQFTYTNNLTFGSKTDIGYLMNRAGSSKLIDIQLDYAKSIFEGTNPPNYYADINSPNDFTNQEVMSYAGHAKNRVFRLYEDRKYGRISQAQFDAAIARLRTLDNTQDIQNLYFQLPFTNQQNLSLASGNDNFRYRTSINYTNELGHFKGNDNRKFIYDFVSEFELTPRLSLDLQTNLTLINNKAIPLDFYSDDANSYADIFNYNPYDVFYDKNGNPMSVNKPISLEHMSGGRYPGKDTYEIERLRKLGLFDETYYPAVDFNKYSATDKEWAARIQGLLKYKLTKGLNLTFGGQYMYTGYKNQKLAEASSWIMRSLINNTTPRSYSGNRNELNVPVGARIMERRGEQVNYMLRGQLDYDKTFNDHYVSAIVGTEISSNKSTFTNSDQLGYNPESNTFIYVDKLKLSQPLTDVFNPGGVILGGVLFKDGFEDIENRFFSAYSNFHYSYKNRYNFTGSARIDQSNLFGTNPKYRFQPLWSVGAKWRIGNEGFLEEKVEMLDLRASYGMNGNTANKYGPFDIARALQPSAVNDFSQGLGILYYKLNSLRWERTKTLNVGLDTKLFNNKLDISLDFYKKNSFDLLSDVEIDGTLGGSKIPMNTASITNNGYEVTSTYHVINNDNFKWDAFFNYRYNKGTVTEAFLREDLFTLDFAGTVQNLKGFEPNSLMVLEYAGINNKGLGLLKKADGTIIEVNDSPFLHEQFNFKDFISAGTVNPKHVAAFTNNLNYKNFGLSMFFIYQGGHVLLKDSYNGEWISDQVVLVNKDAERAWKNPGDEANSDIPKINSTGPVSLLAGSTKNVLPADFIRLRDVVFSYSLPQEDISVLGLREMTFNLRASNLFLWTKNKEGIDPESHGLGKRYFPTTKTFSLGVNLIF